MLRLVNPQRLYDQLRHALTFPHCGQFHPPHTISERIKNCASDFNRQTRLAHAACADQREQARRLHTRRQFGDFILAPNKRSELLRQVAVVLARNAYVDFLNKLMLLFCA